MLSPINLFVLSCLIFPQYTTYAGVVLPSSANHSSTNVTSTHLTSSNVTSTNVTSTNVTSTTASSGGGGGLRAPYTWPNPDRGFRMELANILDLTETEAAIQQQQVCGSVQARFPSTFIYNKQ